MSAQDTTLEALRPTDVGVEVHLGEGDGQIVVLQRQLSFFGKLELFSVLATVVERAIEAGGATLEDLLKLGEEATTIGVDGTAERIRTATSDSDRAAEAQKIVLVLARVVAIVPEAMKDLYLVALQVPTPDRERVGAALEAMDDEQAISIAETFVDQNWSALVDFFTKRLKGLLDSITEKTAATASEPSTPSSPSAQPTQSA